jgi:outer membrane lipoprotein carrier protein
MPPAPRAASLLTGWCTLPCLRSFLALLLTSLFLCAPALAQDFGALSSVEEIVKAVEGVYGNVEALQADFVQVSRSAALGDEQRQKGRVVVKRPRKMRWEFTTPDKKLFLTDGETMWIWSPADNQVIVYKDFSSNGSDVTGLLSDLNKLNELFTVALVADEGDDRAYVLDLTPRGEGAGNFKQLRISFTKRKLLVDRVLLTDQFDNVTDLSFTAVKLDAKVEDDSFVFQVPAGAEVITPEGF